MTEPKIRDILVGLYTKQESKFFNEHYTFTISTRKEVTKSKPKFYLLFKERKERKYRYFSSLYPTKTEKVYSAEHKGIAYHIKGYKSNVIEIATVCR